MKMLKTTLLFIGIITFCNVTAQNTEEKWEKGITIGQSSDNSHTKSLPAQFISTYPSDPDKENSHSINGFIDLNFSKILKNNSKIKFSIFYERHKNTLIDKKQDLYQFGIGMDNTFSLPSESLNPLYLLTNVSIRKSEDKIEQKKGIQYLAYTSFTWSKNSDNTFISFLKPKRVYPGNDRTNITETDSKKEENEKLKEKRKLDWSSMHISDFLQLKHDHSIGLEQIGYEKLTMFNASFNIDVYPFSGLLYSAFGKYQILKIHYAITYRENLNEYNGELYIGSLIKKGVSLNYNVDEKEKTVFSLGYEYSDGGNPLKGLKDNSFGQLTIGAKVNL